MVAEAVVSVPCRQVPNEDFGLDPLLMDSKIERVCVLEIRVKADEQCVLQVI